MENKRTEGAQGCQDKHVPWRKGWFEVESQYLWILSTPNNSPSSSFTCELHQKGLPIWHRLPSGVPPVSPLATLFCESHMALCCGLRHNSMCLPTKRCYFSNWQSLFRCLATSWQTPVLTGGVGDGGCCLRGRIRHPINSSLSHCSPSLEWRDISSIISSLGKRQYSMRSLVPTHGHLLCRDPTKITPAWRGRDQGWWVPEKVKGSDDEWRLRHPPCQIYRSTLASQGPVVSRLAGSSRGSSECWVSKPSLGDIQTEWLQSQGLHLLDFPSPLLSSLRLSCSEKPNPRSVVLKPYRHWNHSEGSMKLMSFQLRNCPVEDGRLWVYQVSMWC